MSSPFIPLFRGAFLHLSQQKSLRRWIESSSAAHRLTRRFIAGLALEDGIGVVRQLQSYGMLATLDHLGENVQSLDEAYAARDAYLEALGHLAARQLDATISVKVTALGLDISREACRKNVAAIVERAQANGTRVEFDMESAIYTDRTLEVVREMHDRFGSVRAVIQAYLYRSEGDVEDLCRRRIPIRLCKGAYKEPPDVAYPRKSEVDENYRKLMRFLLERGTYPAIASHDEAILQEAVRYAKTNALAPGDFEFQMLYGVRRDLQKWVVDQGYRLRVYVPYGEAWYPYFMRRLAERPANVLFLVRNLLKG